MTRRWMRAVALAMAALPGQAEAQARDSRVPTVIARAWAAHLGTTAEACGLREPGFAEALRHGLLQDAHRDPAMWGIPTSRTMGMTAPDGAETARAIAAMQVAAHIGGVLHARLPAPVCTEARQRLPTVAQMAIAPATPEQPLPETMVAGTTGLFIVALATDACRLRRSDWAEKASITPATPLTEAASQAPTTGPRMRRMALARIDGMRQAATFGARMAHQAYGTQLCLSLRTWPELAQLDAAVEAERRMPPEDRWRDVTPNPPR